MVPPHPLPSRLPVAALALVLIWLAGSAVGVPRAVAGAAGGVGAAELAEREVAVEVAAVANGSLPRGGTIREALGGGVVEPALQSDQDVVGVVEAALVDNSGGNIRSGSRCPSPQVCTRVELCPPTDVLFECAPESACCGRRAGPSPGPGPGSANPVYPAPGMPAPAAYVPEYRPQSPPPGPPVVYPPPPSSNPPLEAVRPTRPAAPSAAPTTQGGRPGVHDNGVASRATTTALRQTTPIPTTRPPAPPPAPPTAPQPAPAPSSLLPDTDTCGRVLIENRITNGKIASPGQFPWMALLGYNRRGNVSFLCGGTLINERYVLTAAHCFTPQNRPVIVRLGEFNLTTAVDCDHDKVCAPPHQDVAVESVTPHPDFDIRNIKHDIALIRLRRRVSHFSDFVRPICMPLSLNVTDERKFTIAGWGKTDFKDAGGSPVLQYTDVGGVGHAECSELQPADLQPLGSGQLCAGGDKGKDACKGDSGGPLMVTLATNPPADVSPSHVTYQIGVVSYGPDSPCGTAPLPSIYTRVSSYVPWILSTIKP